MFGIPRASITPDFKSSLKCEIVGIMLRNGCWSTIFHTITIKDVDGWCHKWSVLSTPLTMYLDMSIIHNMREIGSCAYPQRYVNRFVAWVDLNAHIIVVDPLNHFLNHIKPWLIKILGT